jgi:hypothetical protein
MGIVRSGKMLGVLYQPTHSHFADSLATTEKIIKMRDFQVNFVRSNQKLFSVLSVFFLTLHVD